MKVDEMSTGDGLAFLQAELDRAIREIRAALSNLAVEMRAPGWIMRVCTLLDRVECHVIPDPGDSAFEIDEGRQVVGFRGAVLARIWEEMDRYTSEVSPDSDFTREKQLAINQFVVHELLHIRQNFPEFATVDTVKKGLPGYGLPLFDIAADTASAWIAAEVETHRTAADEDTKLRFFVNALMRAYIIGSRVFDARTKPEKRQRALGLLISAGLVQAKLLGQLCEEEVFDGWSPEKPILCLNVVRSETFNAMVLDGLPGLLVDNSPHFELADLKDVWEAVGSEPAALTLAKVVGFLKALGAIISVR